MNLIEYTQYDEKDVLNLYNSVGWTAYTQDPVLLKKGFEGSLLVLAAFEADSLVGIARVVGDGNTIVLVQDLLVSPEYQRKGIGSALLKSVLERFRQVRQIQLVTDDTHKTLAFYRKLGFEDIADLGCRGLMWTDGRKRM